MKILGFFIWKSKKFNKRRIVPWQKLGGGEEVVRPLEMYSKPSRVLQKDKWIFARLTPLYLPQWTGRVLAEAVATL